MVYFLSYILSIFKNRAIVLSQIFFKWQCLCTEFTESFRYWILLYLQQQKRHIVLFKIEKLVTVIRQERLLLTFR